jgi:hypothetical protein
MEFFVHVRAPLLQTVRTTKARTRFLFLLAKQGALLFEENLENEKGTAHGAVPLRRIMNNYCVYCATNPSYAPFGGVTDMPPKSAVR